MRVPRSAKRWIGFATMTAIAVAVATGLWLGGTAGAQTGAPDDLRARMYAYRAAFAASAGQAPGGAVSATSSTLDPIVWGQAGDTFLPADYDGDGKADHAVWRPGAEGVALFKIRRSSDGTELDVIIGKTGDSPNVIGDFDGDGMIDPAIYRPGATAGAYSIWIYRSSATNSLVTVTCSAAFDCGKNGDFPAPGDYNGDGKTDFAVQRVHSGAACASDPTQGSIGTPNADFLIALNGGAVSTVSCVGRSTDVIVAGDYDGDLITDLAVTRGTGGVVEWSIRNSSTGTYQVIKLGSSATDFVAPGDYDGDGRIDPAVWRPSATPGASAFYVKPIAGGAVVRFPMGQNGDFPVANAYTH